MDLRYQLFSYTKVANGDRYLGFIIFASSLSFAYRSFAIKSYDQPAKQFICIKRNKTSLNKAAKPAMLGAVIDGIMVSTLNCESGDLSSNVGRTYYFARKKAVTFLTVFGCLPPHFFNFFDFLISYYSTC